MDGDLRTWDSGLAPMSPRRYRFDGEMVTATELSRRVTCYSKTWLGEALKAGCKSIADLSLYFAEGARRKAKGNRAGRKATSQHRPLDCRRRHLKPD